jgi:hypothetical protein
MNDSPDVPMQMIVEPSDEIEEAAQQVKHADGLVWLVIQSAASKFDLNDDGVMEYMPDDENWESLTASDVPGWAQLPPAIKDMMAGKRICMEPDAGGRWYRGIKCTPPTLKERIH